MKIEKNSLLWYLSWFFYPMAVWAIGQSLWSALHGPGYSVGASIGIVVGNWPIGAISHHWDPLILGATIFFGIWSWNHVPPEKKEIKSPADFGVVSNLTVFVLAGLIGVRLIGVGGYFERTPVGVGLSLLFMVCLLAILFPQGYKNFVLTIIIAGSALAIALSPILMVIALAVVWSAKWAKHFLWRLGKWLIWILWNFIRGGGQGVRKAIQERLTLQPGPPTGDSDHGIVHVDIPGERVCES